MSIVILGNIKLERPLCFFDLEATGLDVYKDRICSISVNRINVNGSIDSKYSLINPSIPIPAESTTIHGITNEMVESAPYFKQLSKALYTFFEGCDIAGYNNNSYDNALLQEEFFRCGIDFPNPENILSIDVCTIFKKFEKRDLSAAMKFYCGKDMMDAHNAESDNNATIEVFESQLLKYPVLQGKTIKELSDFCKLDNRVDWGGRIIKDENGEYIFNFGNARGS